MGHRVSTRNPQGFKGSQTVAADSQLSLGMIFRINGEKTLDSEELKTALLTAARGENLEWGEIEFFFKKGEVFFPIKFFSDDIEIIDSESIDDHYVEIDEDIVSIKKLQAKLKKVENRLNKKIILGVERTRLVCELRSTLPA